MKIENIGVITVNCKPRNGFSFKILKTLPLECYFCLQDV